MPLTAEPSTTTRTSPLVLTVACAVLLALAAGGVWCIGQVGMVPSAVPPSMSVDVGHSHSPLASNAHAQLHLTSAGPSWREITEAQRLVLMPLRDRWNSIGALAKRRWLVLADRYPDMDASERNKLVSRMNTWASLSAQQRNQARLNFKNTKRLSAQELQTKWDEYQALSEAEKQRLAEQARKAKSARKSKQRKLAQVPPLKASKSAATTAETPASASPITVTVHPVAVPAPMVQTQPVHTPKAAPAVELDPLVSPSAASAPLDSTPVPHAKPAASTPLPDLHQPNHPEQPALAPPSLNTSSQ